jgi:hypothetical protein
MTTIRVQQGSQPTLADVRVGVMIAGLRHGVPTTRLLLRSDDESVRVDVVEGDSVDLLGRGRLTVDRVHPRTVREERDEVTLTFEPTPARPGTPEVRHA